MPELNNSWPLSHAILTQHRSLIKSGFDVALSKEERMTMTHRLARTKGFTLIEIIVVMIIVGVLSGLALPRFFATVEFSRSTEALISMGALRQAMERCFLANSGTYAGSKPCTKSTLDLEDPGNSPGAHFSYTVANQTVTGYTITATRNTYEGGDGSSTILLNQSSSGVSRSGTTSFSGIK